jgi:hypothetical protein
VIVTFPILLVVVGLGGGVWGCAWSWANDSAVGTATAWLGLIMVAIGVYLGLARS